MKIEYFNKALSNFKLNVILTCFKSENHFLLRSRKGASVARQRGIPSWQLDNKPEGCLFLSVDYVTKAKNVWLEKRAVEAGRSLLHVIRPFALSKSQSDFVIFATKFTNIWVWQRFAYFVHLKSFPLQAKQNLLTLSICAKLKLFIRCSRYWHFVYLVLFDRRPHQIFYLL